MELPQKNAVALFINFYIDFEQTLSSKIEQKVKGLVV